MVTDRNEDPADVTRQVLHDMLTENTGIALCDSGGSCGRMWQRNQGRDFENEPWSVIHADGGGSIYMVHNTYHWLAERLEYNPELDQRFHDFANAPEREDDRWLACMAAFMQTLQDEDESVGGIYGEGDPMIVNTYNGEECLSQILQFAYWEDGNGEHVLLQIHGGADVRGGYTKPRAFDVQGNNELSMFEYAEGSVYCTDQKPGVDPDQTCLSGESPEDCHAAWDFRGGYWEPVDDWQTGKETPDLDSLAFVEHDADDTPDGESPAPGKGYIYVDENEVPHCPICGSPLESSFF